MADVLSEKELEVVELVIRALPEHLVVVKLVKVFTVEDGESSNLRFTAHDGSFTDLKRDLVSTGGESSETLAKLVQDALLQEIEAPAS